MPGKQSIRSVAIIKDDYLMLYWAGLRKQGRTPTDEELMFAAKCYRSWSAFDREGKETAMSIVCRHTQLNPADIILNLNALELQEARESEQRRKQQKADQRDFKIRRQQAIARQLEAKAVEIKEQRIREVNQMKIQREKKQQELRQKKEAEKAATTAAKEKAKTRLTGQQPVTLQLNGATITGTASAIAVILAKLESRK